MEYVIVTGGAGGIGQEVSKKMCENGYHVIVLDNDEENGNKIAMELGSDLCTFVKIDITDCKQIGDYCDSLPKGFAINHIICIAGRALKEEWQNFSSQPLNCLHKSIELNLTGHINIIHYFYPFIKNADKNKSILLISSINALGNFGLPGYSAAKSGMYGFMVAVAKEFGEDGIRINTLTLGTVVTPATSRESKNFNKLLDGTVLNEFVTIKNVATMVFDICKDFTTLTGQNIVLDSGQSIRRIC